MDYTIRVLRKCKEYGFKVYVDPHQDIVSVYNSLKYLLISLRRLFPSLAVPLFCLAVFLRSISFWHVPFSHTTHDPSIFNTLLRDIACTFGRWYIPICFNPSLSWNTVLSLLTKMFISLSSFTSSGLDIAVVLEHLTGHLKHVA